MMERQLHIQTLEVLALKKATTSLKMNLNGSMNQFLQNSQQVQEQLIELTEVMIQIAQQTFIFVTLKVFLLEIVILKLYISQKSRVGKAPTLIFVNTHKQKRFHKHFHPFLS